MKVKAKLDNEKIVGKREEEDEVENYLNRGIMKAIKVICKYF
jgi:hypothetical protein